MSGKVDDDKLSLHAEFDRANLRVGFFACASPSDAARIASKARTPVGFGSVTAASRHALTIAAAAIVAAECNIDPACIATGIGATPPLGSRLQ